MDKSHMPKAYTSHHHWYSSLVDSINSKNPTSLDEYDLTSPSSSSFLYTYNHVHDLHGFSVVLSLEELEVLKQSPGYVSAYCDSKATLDTTHTPDFLSLNHSIGLWPASNYGENVIIGVIDCGVWP